MNFQGCSLLTHKNFEVSPRQRNNIELKDDQGNFPCHDITVTFLTMFLLVFL